MSVVRALSEVAEIKAGHTFRGKADDPGRLEGIRIIQIKDIKEGGVNPAGLSFAAVEGDRVSNVLEEGDILFPLRGSRVEAMVFPQWTEGKVITTNQVAVIRVTGVAARSEYISWYLNSDKGKRSVASLKVGSVVSNIGLRDLSALKLPIPALEVQDRILELRKNWLARKSVLEEMLLVGQELSELACLKFME